jgi:hypothetical protein
LRAARPQLLDYRGVRFAVRRSVNDGADTPNQWAVSAGVIDVEVSEKEDVDAVNTECRKAFTDWRFGSPGID